MPVKAIASHVLPLLSDTPRTDSVAVSVSIAGSLPIFTHALLRRYQRWTQEAISKTASMFKSYHERTAKGTSELQTSVIRDKFSEFGLPCSRVTESRQRVLQEALTRKSFVDLYRYL